MYTMLDIYIYSFEVKNLKKELGDFNYKRYEGWNFNGGNYLFTTDTK